MRFTEFISEAGSPAQQAAIAVAMKKAGKKPKGVAEGSSNTDVKKQISKFEELALAANRAGDDAKCKQYQQKIQSLKQKMSQGVAEGSLNELSSGLLQRAAQLAKNKRNQAMEPELHNALGGGYMNPLATHYDDVSQKINNRAAQVGKKETIQKIASKIASPAVMRKIGMSGVAESEYDSRKPFGVRYKVFAGREGRMTTKEYWTSSEEKLQRAVDKIQALDNFYEIDGYSYPKESQGVAEGASDNIPTIGINVRSDGDIDYASLIVDGEKKYESRKTDSLRPYVGKIVGIVRTGNGPAVAIGQVTIGEPIIVDAEKFNRFRKQHLVPQGSKFDIDSDGTKYLYPMIDPVRWDNEKPIKHRGIVSRKIQEQGVAEEWSKKYKNSINCSHPKGFSQKAHCAGKKKHNESIEMEMVCEDCGMCKTHGDHENLDEACWKGYHKEGNKKMFGKTYPNCVKNEGEESTDQVLENLHKWFKEKWVRFGPDGKIRGDCARGSESEGKPKCLPQSKAHSLGKKGRASAASRKRREDPNANRSGKAINVSTKGKGK